MSLYADYIREHHGDEIIETELGYATYRYLPCGTTVYIVDIYVVPSARRGSYASIMADNIVGHAKEKGCTKLIGTVAPTAKGSTDSLRVLLGYGMQLSHIDSGLVVFKKEI